MQASLRKWKNRTYSKGFQNFPNSDSPFLSFCSIPSDCCTFHLSGTYFPLVSLPTLFFVGKRHQFLVSRCTSDEGEIRWNCYPLFPPFSFCTPPPNKRFIRTNLKPPQRISSLSRRKNTRRLFSLFYTFFSPSFSSTKPMQRIKLYFIRGIKRSGNFASFHKSLET